MVLQFDKWFMTKDREFERPEGVGPDVRLHTGKLPEAFAYVKAVTPPSQPPQPEPDAIRVAGNSLQITAAQFSLQGTGYYLDRGKWLASNPEKHKEARVETAFSFPGGRYDVSLFAVGEEDGRSAYQFAVNDTKVGEYKCPLSSAQFEEAAKFSTTWKNIAIDSGDVLTLSTQVASNDGQEYSRARIARLVFTAADEATKAAVAKLVANRPAVAKTRPKGPPLVLPRKPDGNGKADISGQLKQWHKVTLTLDGPYRTRARQPAERVYRSRLQRHVYS